MRIHVLAAAALVSVLAASESRADGEVAFVFGASISGDFSVLDEGFAFDDVQAALKNSPVFGLRLGSYGWPFGIEGSLVYSPSAVTGGAFDDLIEANANVLYAEANLLFIILPGPIQPFITGGVGLHYVRFDLVDIVSLDQTKFGYNFGGGLKFNVTRLVLRVDLRDHVTTFGLDDFGLGIIGGLFGIDRDARLHNVELSFGVGIRF